MGYVGKVTAGGSTHPVGSTLYGTCSTAAATAVKVVTCADFDELIEGVTIHVKFEHNNSAEIPSMNVNSTGAKLMVGVGPSPASSWVDGSVVSFTYDGTSWLKNDSVLIDETIPVYGGIGVPTSIAVMNYVATQMSEVAGALVYKGTVSAGTALLNTALKKGWYYIVDTAGSYAGATCEPGDMIIVHTAGTYTTATALAAAVDVIQTNIDTISNSEIDTIVAS